jgi:N-methylhydantoinase A
MNRSVQIGIDVGGTFTDVVACGTDGLLTLHKVPTTPHDIGQGIGAGLTASGVPIQDVAEIAHGTTVATNALLERRGARTGLLTTRGFRDVLELRDGGRRALRGWQSAFEALVPRQHCWDILERLDAGGGVLDPLAEDGLPAIVDALRREKIEALAVSFLHSDRSTVHEERAESLLRHLWPEGWIIRGSSVCPFPDERLRAGTAALTAFLAPLMDRYVSDLERALAGAAASVRFIESAGGSCTPEEARRHPLQTILSGPAGGARAAASLGNLLALPAVLTADVGGTSLDAALIEDGEPELRSDRHLEFGLRVALPSVAIQTAGIGGGSIIQVDESIPGGLRVGPESAGASPGPACFGKGGRKPTLTDANLLLGRLVEDRSDLGLPPLDREAAELALLADVCPSLGLDPVGAARVIAEVAEARMTGFLRTQLAARGIAPGDATLVAFGGAGPIQAALVARALGLRRVVVPYLASGFSALGCLLCPPARTAMVPVEMPLGAFTPARLAERLAFAFPDDGRERLRLALVIARGENPWEDLLPLHGLEEAPEDLTRRYHAFTERAYGIRPAPESIRVLRLLALREEGSARLDLGPALEATFARARAEHVAVERAPSGPNGLRHVAVESLEIERPGTGPAQVVLPGASVFVPKDMDFHIDRWGNTILEPRL